MAEPTKEICASCGEEVTEGEWEECEICGTVICSSCAAEFRGLCALCAEKEEEENDNG